MTTRRNLLASALALAFVPITKLPAAEVRDTRMVRLRTIWWKRLPDDPEFPGIDVRELENVSYSQVPAWTLPHRPWAEEYECGPYIVTVEEAVR